MAWSQKVAECPEAPHHPNGPFVQCFSMWYWWLALCSNVSCLAAPISGYPVGRDWLWHGSLHGGLASGLAWDRPKSSLLFCVKKDNQAPWLKCLPVAYLLPMTPWSCLTADRNHVTVLCPTIELTLRISIFKIIPPMFYIKHFILI